MSSQAAILSLHDVRRDYAQPSDLVDRVGRTLRGLGKAPVVQAVAGVDLAVIAGEVIGIVGESGCGKSTLGRMVAGILPPSGGEIRYWDKSVAGLSGTERRKFELDVQMIFQDPFSSLNPRMRVLDIIGEGPVVHGMVKRRDMERHVVTLMRKVGLDPAYRFRYPHQFSGGQRQRIGIARALAVNPSVIVCDEAVAALDVSIQAQVLNLFMALRKEFDLTYLFISHNLGVVSHISDRVAIMYLGRIVEIADTDTIFSRAHHPYTQALIKELPSLRLDQRQFAPIQGELPSALNPPPGCPFHPRCPYVMARCRTERPLLRNIGVDHVGDEARADNGLVEPPAQAVAHLSACHLEEAVSLQGMAQLGRLDVIDHIIQE